LTCLWYVKLKKSKSWKKFENWKESGWKERQGDSLSITTPTSNKLNRFKVMFHSTGVLKADFARKEQWRKFLNKIS
jgi:hypothetical protein